MPRLRSLTLRILVVVLVSTAIGIPVVWSILLRGVPDVFAARASDFARPALERTRGLGCDDDPARWSLRTEGGGSAYAYDTATGRSLNPEAPPLDRLLQARVRLQNPVFRAYLDDRSYGELLFRRADAGPCSLLYARWPAASLRGEIRVWLLLALIAGSALALSLAVGGVLRPTLRRIGVLARAADEVGGAAPLPPSIAEGGDELARVGQRLLGADARIHAAHAAIEAKNHALAAYLVQIAHDLRSPLASLQLTLEDLSRSIADARPWVGQAIDSALYIEALCDNLQIASQLREGLVAPHALTAVDLAALVDRVVARLTPLARHRAVSLAGARPDGSVEVRWLGVLAERVISNLVDNAIRHSGADHHVAVVLDVTREGFELVVADDGPGITDAALAAAREPWQSPDGHGLGLRIAFALAGQGGLRLEIERDAARGGTRACLSGARLGEEGAT